MKMYNRMRFLMKTCQALSTRIKKIQDIKATLLPNISQTTFYILEGNYDFCITIKSFY